MKGLKITILILFCVPIFGLLFQFLSTKIDDYLYPAPGDFVDIGNCKIHYQSIGDGNPTVIFDSGIGLCSLEWSLVQPEVSKFTRTVSLDRSGYGWSEKSPFPKNSEQTVKELHLVLEKANIPPPYILVGHSLGGINMQLFAHSYPDEVIGMVLVDSSHENQTDRLPKDPDSLIKLNKLIASPLVPYLTLFGIDRFMTHCLPKTKKTFNDAMRAFPEKTRKAYAAKIFTYKTTSSFQDENNRFKESLSQIRDKDIHMNDKPLIVITAGKFVMPYPEIKGISKEWLSKTQIEWNKMQKELANRSCIGKQVIAESSDHVITRNQPQLIIDSILEMVKLNKQ